MKRLLLVLLTLSPVVLAMDKIAILKHLREEEIKQAEELQKRAATEQLAATFRKQIHEIDYNGGNKEEFIKKIKDGIFDSLLDRPWQPPKKDLDHNGIDRNSDELFHPLYGALYAFSHDILKALLERSAQIPNGMTFNEAIGANEMGKLKFPIFIVIQWARIRDQREKVKLLMAYGVDLNIREMETLQTPLMRAAYMGRSDLVELLLAGMIPIKLQNLEALRTIKKNYLSLLPLDMIRAYLTKYLTVCANPSLKNNHGQTALDLARTALEDSRIQRSRDARYYQEIIKILEPITKQPEDQQQAQPVAVQPQPPQRSWWKRWMGR